MSVEDIAPHNTSQDVLVNDNDLTKVRREREEEQAHIETVPFLPESDLEGKEVQTVPINASDYVKASLIDFKPVFDDSYGSARLFFDYNQDVFEAMIVADTNEDLQAGKSALETYLSDYSSQTKRQKIESSDNSTGTDSATLTIPGDAVGLLIGKNGISLRVVEIATNTKVIVDQNNKPDGTRSVTITGAPDCVSKAKKEVLRIRSAPKDGDQSSAPIGPGSYSPEEIKAFEEGYSKTLTIPSNAIKILIGKSGETIRILQIHYDVRIYVTETQDQEAPTRPIVIYGKEEDVEKVCKEIDIIIEAAEKDPSALKNSALLSNVFEYSDTFTVSFESVGLIIGRKGETIKYIQKSTNSNLQIEQTDNPMHPGLRSITITARTEANVKNARALVDQAISNQNFRQNMNMKMFPYNANPNWMPGGPSFDNNMGGMYNRHNNRPFNNFQQRNYQNQGNMGMNRNYQNTYNPNFQMNRNNYQQGGGRFNKFQNNPHNNFQNMNLGMGNMGGMNNMGNMNNMSGMNSNPMGMNTMGMNMSNNMPMKNNYNNMNTNEINGPYNQSVYEQFLAYYLNSGFPKDSAEKSAKFYAQQQFSEQNN